MVVYVEYVFINNLITDYALIRSALLLPGNNSKKLRVLLVAILGAILAVILPFIKTGILPLYKIIVGITLGLLSIKKGSIKEYVKIIGALFLFTFFIGGFLIGIRNIFNIKTDSATYLPIQLVLVLIIVAFSTIIFIRAKRKNEVDKFIYDCTVLVGERTIDCKGFLDTGNRVFSGVTPVVICSKEISKTIDLAQVDGVTYPLKLTTVAGITTVKAIENVEILIYFSQKKHIHKKIVLGLTDSTFISDVILHPSLID